MKAVMHRPGGLPKLREAHGLLGQHLRQVQHVAPPFDFAVVAPLPDERPRGIVDRRQLHGIRSGRPLMHTARRAARQGFVGTRPIIFLHKRREPALLCPQHGGRAGHRRVERPMHPLMPSILTRGPGTNPFRPNAQPHPPRR